VKDSLPNYCMPDAIHNKNEDYVYFTIDVELEEEEGYAGEIKEIDGEHG